VQKTIINILMKKLKKAAIQTGITELCIAGGVSANSGLRQAFTELGVKHQWKTYIPAFQYCTDNAGMIAITAYYKYLASEISDLSVAASARAE
jgi:N6-L-threonylcarbamoyladenine synthase